MLNGDVVDNKNMPPVSQNSILGIILVWKMGAQV